MELPLIDRYAEQLRAAGSSDNTIGSRTRVLRRIDRDLPRGLNEANRDELTAILAACRTAWTRCTYYSHLRGYYRAMVESDRLTFDPSAAIPRPREGDRLPNPVSDEELAAALDRSPEHPWRVVVLVAAYQGLRCAELAELDRADVTEIRVHVRRGKGGRGRYVPTHPAVWEYVRRLPPGPVVVRDVAEPVTAAWLTGAQGRHWRRIGLPGVHLHRFRHWFGSTLAEQDVGLEVIADLMGHTSIATTQGYVRVASARRVAAIRRLPVVGLGPVSTRAELAGVPA